MLIISFTLIVIIITLFWIYCRFKLDYWKRRGVECLKPESMIFGNFKNAILFRTAPGWHVGQLHKACGDDVPFVGFYILRKPCLLLRDPAVIKQLMVRDFDTFCNRQFGGRTEKDSVGMRNLFAVRNQHWKFLRSKISPSVTALKLKQMFPLMMEIGEPMLDFIKNIPSSRDDNVKVIDIVYISDKYTTDLVASVGLGTKIDSFHYPNEEFAMKLNYFFHGYWKMIVLLALFFMPKVIELVGSKRFLLNSLFIEKVFWNAIERREKTGEKRGDFIDTLLQLKQGEQNPDYKFENENLMNQAGNFLGFGSSSTCMSFTLMELANHLECQELARRDINRAIDKHGWTYEAFNDMKYLDQAIAESLRLHPPVTMIDRCPRKDYNIPNTDIVIEKDTPVYVSLYGLAMDPRFWDQPEVFNPDRFEQGKQITDAYLPFGIGPRVCLGRKLGLLHAKIYLALLLHNYEIWQTKDNKTSLDPRATLTAAKDGIILHFRKIE